MSDSESEEVEQMARDIFDQSETSNLSKQKQAIERTILCSPTDIELKKWVSSEKNVQKLYRITRTISSYDVIKCGSN